MERSSLYDDIEAAFQNLTFGLSLISTSGQERFDEKDSIEIGLKAIHMGFCLIRRAEWRTANGIKKED